MARPRSVNDPFLPDSLHAKTLWQQGEESGEVSDRKSSRFCVECVNVTDVVLGDHFERVDGRPINKPKWITLDFAQRLLERFAPGAPLDADHPSVVSLVGVRYRLVA